VGLPVTSWRAGDPTRSLYKYLAEALAERDGVVASFIKSGFRSSAVADANESGDSSWLRILALEVYGVEAPEASYATPTVTVTNSGGGYYEIAAGDLTFEASASGKTFHNTSGPIVNDVEGTSLSAGQTATFELVADEAGSDSSVNADEVDAFVTPLLGVTIVSSTASVASDEASPDEIDALCEASLGALSPNGPPDAYEYVCLNQDLTGVTDITRADTVDDSDTGDVTVYVASSTGPAAGGSVTAAQEAVDLWATPLTITAIVENATGVNVNVTATCSGEDIPADVEDVCETALQELFVELSIGAVVSKASIIATIYAALREAGASDVVVTLTLPADDTDLDAGEVPVLGTVTVTEV
jgi:hypothetical protein